MALNILKSIFVSVVVFALSLLGYIVYKQEGKIAVLEQGYIPKNDIASTSLPESLPPIPKLMASDSQIFTILKNQTSINGTISAIQGNLLTVESSVPDMSLLSKTDISKPFSVSYIKKTYHIKIVSTTIFKDKNISSLKIGDTVSISSANSIIDTDTFDAKEISSI